MPCSLRPFAPPPPRPTTGKQPNTKALCQTPPPQSWGPVQGRNHRSHCVSRMCCACRTGRHRGLTPPPPPLLPPEDDLGLERVPCV